MGMRPCEGSTVGCDINVASIGLSKLFHYTSWASSQFQRLSPLVVRCKVLYNIIETAAGEIDGSVSSSAIVRCDPVEEFGQVKQSLECAEEETSIVKLPLQPSTSPVDAGDRPIFPDALGCCILCSLRSALSRRDHRGCMSSQVVISISCRAML
jgi:hypothetical protein